MTKHKDLRQVPIQPKRCRSCPFGGEQPIDLSPESLAEYTRKVVNLESQHICHSARRTVLCRGGRELMLSVMTARGWISAPTNEAYDKALNRALEKKP